MYYNLLDMNSIDLDKKIITDLSGNDNHGTIIRGTPQKDSQKGLQMSPGVYISCNNLFKTRRSYSIQFKFTKLPDLSQYGNSRQLLTTRDTDETVDGLMFYIANYPLEQRLEIWDWGKDGIALRAQMSLNNVSIRNTNNYDFRIFIDSITKNVRMDEMLSKSTATSSFPYRLPIATNEMQFRGWDGWLQSFKVYEGAIDFDKLPISLLMDSNGDLYTINMNDNLEIVSNINNVTKDVIETHGKDISAFKSALPKWNKDRFKIITMEVK